MGVDLLGVNCGRGLDDNLEVLKELRQATELPIWFKPNAGKPELDAQGDTVYRMSPEEMGAQVGDWIDNGAQVIGGCCGTSPQHLGQIAGAVQH